MKISKLFHWLYAILMFLPIMVFIPNAFYYGFNHEAVAQEKTEQVPVYYNTNEVNSVNDLVDGNYYRLLCIQDQSVLPLYIYFYDYNVISYVWSGQLTQTSSTTRFHILWESNQNTLRCYNENNVNNRNYQGYVIDFIYKDVSNYTNYQNYIDVGGIIECPIQYVKEYQLITTSMSITDSMSYAWKSTWQNELFSWSYDSFLTQPFLYITNLFNVPATNTLLYCLSYWLNISIIWLCFDVVMYVPLLVHRWIDKGIVE